MAHPFRSRRINPRVAGQEVRTVLEWVVLIPLIVVLLPAALIMGIIAKIRERRFRGWFPEEGGDGVGVPAGLVPGPPSLACKHAEKWPSEFVEE
jgi:hypothetical protein